MQETHLTARVVGSAMSSPLRHHTKPQQQQQQRHDAAALHVHSSTYKSVAAQRKQSLSGAIKEQICVLQRELQIARHQVIILTDIN